MTSAGIEDEEFEAVEVESTRTIEIDQFVPRNEIDDRYIDSPYYIAPDGQVGQDAPQDDGGASQRRVMLAALTIEPSIQSTVRLY